MLFSIHKDLANPLIFQPYNDSLWVGHYTLKEFLNAARNYLIMKHIMICYKYTHVCKKKKGRQYAIFNLARCICEILMPSDYNKVELIKQVRGQF